VARWANHWHGAGIGWEDVIGAGFRPRVRPGANRHRPGRTGPVDSVRRSWAEANLPEYRVYRGDVLLGTLTETGSDISRWERGFDAAPGFEAVRPLFDRERELLDADRMEKWGEAWDELAEGLRLEPLDGRDPITGFLLHIDADGQHASWRY
jgi:hypothetical protein